MALNGLYCADVPLSNYSLTHSQRQPRPDPLWLVEHLTSRLSGIDPWLWLLLFQAAPLQLPWRRQSFNQRIGNTNM